MHCFSSVLQVTSLRVVAHSFVQELLISFLKSLSGASSGHKASIYSPEQHKSLLLRELLSVHGSILQLFKPGNPFLNFVMPPNTNNLFNMLACGASAAAGCDCLWDSSPMLTVEEKQNRISLTFCKSKNGDLRLFV